MIDIVQLSRDFSKRPEIFESDESSPYYNGLDEYFFRALVHDD